MPCPNLECLHIDCIQKLADKVSAGQHYNTEITCINCNVIEDKFHFVLECKLFTYIRNRYIPVFYRKHPSMYKLIKLINNENKNIIRNLGVFIQKAFELRNSIHYAQMLTNFE